MLKKLLVILITCSSFVSNEVKKTHDCTATWYDTTPHPIIRREHSTAAISKNLIDKLGIKVANKTTNQKGTFLIVTNLSNKKIDTIEVTDRCAAGPNHIDLSKNSFGKLAKHSQGRINVTIKKIK
jgi:rare lipoprotein A (peptidoglycan hydrolase)